MIALEMGLLVRLDLLLRKPQTLIVAAEIYQRLGQERERLAQHRVHGGSKEWLKPPFHVQQKHPFWTCEAVPRNDGTPADRTGRRPTISTRYLRLDITCDAF